MCFKFLSFFVNMWCSNPNCWILLTRLFHDTSEVYACETAYCWRTVTDGCLCNTPQLSCRHITQLVCVDVNSCQWVVFSFWSICGSDEDFRNRRYIVERYVLYHPVTVFQVVINTSLSLHLHSWRIHAGIGPKIEHHAQRVSRRGTCRWTVCTVFRFQFRHFFVNVWCSNPLYLGTWLGWS